MSAATDNGHRWMILLGVGVLIAVGIVIGILGMQLRKYRTLHACDWNLKLIEQAVFVEGGLLQSPLSAVPELKYAQECPCTKTPFAYRPFGGLRRTEEEIRQGAMDRMVAWSPKLCPDGRRHVLRESGMIDKLTEDQFQAELRRSNASSMP
jgi:hypothetical protein